MECALGLKVETVQAVAKKTSSTTYLLFCISYGKKGGNSRIIQKFECMPPPAWSPLLFGTQEKETNLSNIPWVDTGWTQ